MTDHGLKPGSPGQQGDGDPCSDGAYPLSAAHPGRPLKVMGLNGGKMLSSRLASLGIIPGSDVSVVCNSGGPVIVEVKGSRLSLGQGMARKIMVK